MKWSQAAIVPSTETSARMGDMLSAIDRERCDLRELMDERPLMADEFATAGTQLQMGARSVVIDCLAVYHEDPERVIARLVAWDLLTR